MYVFRQADHPNRRKARYYDWPRILEAERPAQTHNRQSARIRTLLPTPVVHPIYTPITRDSITSEDIYMYDGLIISPTHITNSDTVQHYGL